MLDAIYLDVDGLAANWIGGLCRLKRLSESEVLADWPPGVWDAFEVLGLDEDEVWAQIKKIGPAWWESLELLEGARQLYGAARRLAPTFWLTAPPNKVGAGEAAHGKTNWLMRHFGEGTFLVGHDKAAVSRHGTALVDDRDSNVDHFAKHGGVGIVWPQPWNRMHSLGGDLHAKLRTVVSQLEREADKPRW